MFKGPQDISQLMNFPNWKCRETLFYKDGGSQHFQEGGPKSRLTNIFQESWNLIFQNDQTWLSTAALLIFLCSACWSQKTHWCGNWQFKFGGVAMKLHRSEYYALRVPTLYVRKKNATVWWILLSNVNLLSTSTFSLYAWSLKDMITL